MTKNESILNILSGLTVFRAVLNDPIVSSLCDLASSRESNTQQITKYCRFVSELYEANSGDLTEYVSDLVFNSENVYVKTIGSGKKPPEYIAKSVERELSGLSEIASLSKADLCPDCSDELPDFSSHIVDLNAAYSARVNNIGKYGYGKYARSKMFFIDSDCLIVPVRNPDKISLSQLVDYELQRNQIIENTRALLSGKPAANILLTGDAGTGKSSTIKAVVNALADEGLRIIEVRKDQLGAIPKILDELAENPLKFILFIDDLSFLSDDDNFNGLKAVLEGSVSARSENVVVYATSNRRHIIRESFSDRDSDEVHRNDAMQEIISLSDRFGLHISFQKPDKKTYLDIVHKLAQQFEISMPDDEMDLLAERFALSRGGRSARLARQFIDSILSENR